MIGQVYILLGMGIIAMCVNLMQEKIITEVSLSWRGQYNVYILSPPYDSPVSPPATCCTAELAEIPETVCFRL